MTPPTSSGHLNRVLPRLAGLAVLAYFTALSLSRSSDNSWLMVLAWLQLPMVGLTAFMMARSVPALGEQRPGRLLALPAISVLTILGISLALQLSAPYFWDAATSSARASMISQGQGLWSQSQRVSLFYYFLAALQLISNSSVVLIRLVNGLVALAGLWGLGYFLRRHIGPVAAGLTVAMAASQPVLFSLSHWLYIDMFMLTVGVWLLVAGDHFATTGRRRHLLLTVGLGLALLATKEYAWVLLPVAVGLGWARKSTAPGVRFTRRPWLVLAAAGAAFGLTWLAWTVYLHFWRGLFPDQEPNWGLYPMIVVPGNPFLAPGQQWSIGVDFCRQFLLGLTASGLLGLVWLGLVRWNSDRRGTATMAAALGLVGAAVPPFLINFAPLNQLFRFDQRLLMVFWGLGALLFIMRLTGFLKFHLERIQVLLLAGLSLSVLFFCAVGKVSWQGDTLTGFLDWRYLLPALLFIVLLAGFGIRNLLALATAGPSRRLAFLALALAVVPNLVSGTNYIRQVSIFTANQKRGAEKALTMARDLGVGVITGWPYYYPESPTTYNYGPYRWQDANIDLEFVWFHDFSQPSDRILLMDTRCLGDFTNQADRPAAFRFGGKVPRITPLLPRVEFRDSPTVMVLDLADPDA